MKQGCPFYIAFTELKASLNVYRCSGINASHTCERDPLTWDRYARYRNKDPAVRSQAAALIRNGIKSGQAASYLNDQFGVRIQPKDIHRIIQNERQKAMSDAVLPTSDMQALANEITAQGDRYRIKYIDNTQVMHCFFYWDSFDVQLARRFSQVLQIDTTFKDNNKRFPLIEITATTNEMNSFLVAQALIPSESVNAIVWVLEQVI
jgi:MULE transposase domain